jgi:hypothetical protein
MLYESRMMLSEYRQARREHQDSQKTLFSALLSNEQQQEQIGMMPQEGLRIE